MPVRRRVMQRPTACELQGATGNSTNGRDGARPLQTGNGANGRRGRRPLQLEGLV